MTWTNQSRRWTDLQRQPQETASLLHCFPSRFNEHEVSSNLELNFNVKDRGHHMGSRLVWVSRTTKPWPSSSTTPGKTAPHSTKTSFTTYVIKPDLSKTELWEQRGDGSREAQCCSLSTCLDISCFHVIQTSLLVVILGNYCCKLQKKKHQHAHACRHFIKVRKDFQ